MSKLSDKMDELTRSVDVMMAYDFDYLIQKGFTESDISNLFEKDILIWLNDKKTECMTVVLLDSSDVSIQYIKENETGMIPVFLTRHMTFDEGKSLIKIYTRKYKLNKIKNG